MGPNSTEIKVRTETILYTALKYCDRKLYGIPDVLAGKNISDFPAVENAALDDLMENSCATMDFNGKITIDEDYINSIRECIKCNEIVTIDIKRPGGTQDHMTVYYMGENEECVVLKSMDGVFAGVCGIYSATLEELMKQVEVLVDAKGSDTVLQEEYSVQSKVVQCGNTDRMHECGCDKSAIEVISGISNGRSTALVVRKVRGGSEASFYSAVWCSAGSMEMKVEYSEFKELIVFKHVSKSTIMKNINRVLVA